jgi:hypothetical protein
MGHEPLKPRITKSTAVVAIKARFDKPSDLLKRFVIAKDQASLWDGERDGLREVVKTYDAGQYDNVVLSKTTGALVLYPSAAGKYQIESTLQTTIPCTIEEGTVMVFQTDAFTPEEFFALSLEEMRECFLGQGEVVDNDTLYGKKGSETSGITILPEV